MSISRKEKGIATGSKNPSARRILVTYPNGESEIMGCTKEFKDRFNVSQTTFQKIVNSNEPYTLPKGITSQRREILSKLVGITIDYIENTEIIK